MNIHIVLYSQLDGVGGGRETWLRYFLPALRQSKAAESIHVYCLPKTQLVDPSLRVVVSANAALHECGARQGRFSRGLAGSVAFAWSVHKSLRMSAEPGDVVVLVGTIVEGIVGLATRRLAVSRRLRIAVWVRSLGIGEISTRHSRPYVVAASCIEQRLLTDVADIVIANGSDTQEYYCHRYPRVLPKMLCIPNAVDTERFSSVPDIEWSQRHRIRVAYVGRFNKSRGFDQFLSCARAIATRSDGSVEFDFGAWGYGELPETLPRHVTYHGPVLPDELPTVLGSNDVVLFLNRSAGGLAGGLSHGLLEAMAAGRLIVAWDNPAHNQVLNCANSITVPEGDISGLANVLLTIVQRDPAFLHRLCQAARRTADDHSVSGHLHRFIESLDRLGVIDSAMR